MTLLDNFELSTGVAVRCRVLSCFARWWLLLDNYERSTCVLQYVAACCSELCVSVCCMLTMLLDNYKRTTGVAVCVATCHRGCNVLQCVAVCCNALPVDAVA